jgi:hypothetical protein
VLGGAEAVPWDSCSNTTQCTLSSLPLPLPPPAYGCTQHLPHVISPDTYFRSKKNGDEWVKKNITSHHEVQIKREN